MLAVDMDHIMDGHWVYALMCSTVRSPVVMYTSTLAVTVHTIYHPCICSLILVSCYRASVVESHESL